MHDSLLERWRVGARMFSLVAAAFLVALVVSPLSAQLDVPRFDPQKDEILGQEPLVGYRPLPSTLVADLQPSHSGFGISVKIFTASARNVQVLSTSLRAIGKHPTTATWQDWYDAACSLPESTLAEIRKAPPHVVDVGISGSGKITEMISLDANFMALLPTTELFDCKPSVTIRVLNGEDGEMLPPETSAAHSLGQAYTNLSHYSAGGGPSAVQAAFRYASEWTTATPTLASAATFEEGKVTFGKPTVLNAKDARLDVPATVLKDEDVYAVYFAASVRDLKMDEFESFTVGISPKAESVALDLIPLRYETELTYKTTSGAPSIKVGSVEIGSVYQKQIILKSLKPTITAFGLQEQNFSWSLTGDAMQLGSMRFVAILGVPKRLSQLPIEIYAQAKYRESLFSQGGTLSTKAMKTTLKLQ